MFFLFRRFLLRFFFQVTSLVADQPSNTKKGRSKRAHLLVANVIQATENFINKVDEIAQEHPDMRNELIQSIEEVKRTGNKNISFFYLIFFKLKVRKWLVYQKNLLMIHVQNLNVNK